MKSINFKRNESVIRHGASQNKSKRKKINWDRLIYFIILGIVVFFLGRWLYYKFSYVQANGQIIFDGRKIRNLNDSRILEFKVKEGDDVQVGDTLYVYIGDNEDDEGGNSQLSMNIGDVTVNKTKGNDWIDREIYNLEKNIALNITRINEYNSNISSLENELERIRQEVILDVLPKSKLENQERSISSLKIDVQQKQQENSMFTKQISKLKAMKTNVAVQKKTTPAQVSMQNNGNGSGGPGSKEGSKKVLLSPFEGKVTRIYFKEHEVALKSELVMTIHKPKNIRVKAYIEQDDIGAVTVGKEVDIEFPDGTKTVGIVEKFHFTTSRLPEEFQKKYESTTRNIIVDIKPLNINLDLIYHKMEVKIRISKY